MTNFVVDRTVVSENGNGHYGNGHGPRGGRELVEEWEEEGTQVASPARDGRRLETSEDEERRRPSVVQEEGDIIEGVEQLRGARSGKSRGRKAVVGFLVFAILIGVALVAAWFMVGNGATRKAKVPVNGAGDRRSAVQTEDAMTRQAISEANGVGPAVTLSDGSVVRPQTGPGQDEQRVVLQRGSVTQLPPRFDQGDLSETVETRSPNGSSEKGNTTTDAGETQGGGVAKTIVAKLSRNSEQSVRIVDEPSPEVARGRSGVARESNEGHPTPSGDGISVPSFGSMLPVRSLGVLYTFRSGGLVRLELTRDVKGNGWMMKRGTVIVGALRGSEYDRAFVSLVGFIDPGSGKFVQLSGDLLGADGGAGIRGKRKKMTSGWSRVLGRIGEAGLGIAESFAGSVGRRPVIISDAFGRSSRRVTSELDGVLLGKDRDSFVEVAAGSSGYIMVTALPEAVQGVDALAKLSGRDLEERSDVELPRPSTGISEVELAALLQSGDGARIRAALPRMTPEMRKVAEAVLADGAR